jgi:hypothetical protein
MKFPKGNTKLTEIFKKAKTPEISEFNGEYSVDMLTMLPSLRRLSHRKVFYPDNGNILGHNLFFANKKWGHFFLEKGICEELDYLDVTVINYKRDENSFISNRIRDYVRCVKENTIYLGRFNYLFMGKFHFLGYFSLTKLR